MSLQSTAQIAVLEISEPMDPMEVSIPLIPEVHQHYSNSHEMEVSEPEDIIELSELPGAPDGLEDPLLEVVEDTKETTDENDAKKENKKEDKWSWSSKNSEGFVEWIKERFDNVPKHSGMDTSGCQRALAYLEKLDDEISRAMRSDLDGKLEANKVEEVRAKIDDGIERLQDRIEKLHKAKKTSRKKKADVEAEGIIKEAQKISGVKGIFVTVPLLISRLARICINSTISAGKDIEHTFRDQVKKYKLNDREQAELVQLLDDMGFTIRADRGLLGDEEVDVSSTDNYDWMQNFRG